MADALPKLTRPQMARLIEVGKTSPFGRGRASYRDSPALTKALESAGLVLSQGGKIAKTGRVIWHADAVLTPLGVYVLAGLPGDEFQRFRDEMAREETASCP